jgi:hypothetical protein
MSDVQRLLAQGFWLPGVGEDGQPELPIVEQGVQKMIDAIQAALDELENEGIIERTGEMRWAERLEPEMPEIPRR